MSVPLAGLAALQKMEERAGATVKVGGEWYDIRCYVIPYNGEEILGLSLEDVKLLLNATECKGVQ